MILAAANGSPIRVEEDARLEFIRDGMKCSMKFLDEGNVVVFGQHESFIEHVKHGSENSNVQEEWCVRDAIGHSTMPEDDKIREIQRGRCDEEDVGFHEAGVTNNVEEIRERCKTETKH